MRRLWQNRFFASTVLATLGLSAANSAIAEPVLRIQVDQAGDILAIGNTIGYDCGPGAIAPVVGVVGACGQNTVDTAADLYFNGSAANLQVTPAQAQSSATLTIPAGATVTNAFLYWGGAQVGADTSVTFSGPGFSQVVQADSQFEGVLSGNQAVYHAGLDVTNLVAAAGSGSYTVGGISVDEFRNLDLGNVFGAWTLVLFYADPAEPVRNLALFHGLDVVASGGEQNALLTGFTVPNAGFQGKLGVVTFEGDNQSPGDALVFDGAILSDAQNPANNFFNSTRSTLGAPVSVAGDLPRLTGTAQSMGGYDLDIIDVTAELTAGQTQAAISATSSGDTYGLGLFFTSISTLVPNFSSSEKTYQDVNGGSLLAGDEVLFTITATNTGNDTSVDTVLVDTLPAGMTYVPGSLTVDGVSRTDGAGDDTFDYNLGLDRITVRLGTGANAINGGTMLVGASSVIRFRVTIDAGASGSLFNQAEITAEGLQGAPADSWPTSSPTGVGEPTEVPVDECLVNSDCEAPTPFCLTAANPNECVECLQDADCESNSCDPLTNTCGCVGGDVCSVGVGACERTGVTVCMGGSAVCDAVPGNPAPIETCDDNIDADCDGFPSNGCDGDDDGDGLTNQEEEDIGTNPLDADSDDDGILDGDEPDLDEDTDGDGSINALDSDSDNDGLFDGTEVGNDCSNPATNEALGHCIADADDGATTTDPLDPDTDDGGVPDGSEDTNLNGQVDGTETDPTDGNGADDSSNEDDDNDGLSTDLEIFLGSDPNDADTDDDGVIDGEEANPADDHDGDGLINVLDTDSDNDGLFDGTEMGRDCSNSATDVSLGHCIPDGDEGDTTTSPIDRDTDDGGAIDGNEDINLNGVVDGDETDPTDGNGDDDSDEDTDGDGFLDDFEIEIGTDPTDGDSDDDGVIDGQEANPADDTDGDGLINALDPDSDGDGLFDGTEVGNDCSNPDTDTSLDLCIADEDEGETRTGVLDPDTDDGGVNDGDEDLNHNGVVDAGETDPTKGNGDDDDSDGDGLPDDVEIEIGTNPNDADSDDDGVIDGEEPSFDQDSDDDGLINALDSDSDDDGLFDGTELGLDCSNPATDVAAEQCIADEDPSTQTDPLDPDTDDGTVNDGDEDKNHNGKLDAGETDPTAGNGADDLGIPPECITDADCGAIDSGLVCDNDTSSCIEGCRGSGGNGCPSDELCSSDDTSIGQCSDAADVNAEGNGIFCSATPSGRSDTNSAPWAVALAVLGLAAARRRR